jgi:N-acetylglucosamine-6-sulfatase
MTRTLGVTGAVAALVALAAWVLPGGPLNGDRNEAAAQTAHPNIVVILTDDQRADQLGRMPAVADLAADGLTFANAYVSNPLCCPSRATILTGRYSHTTGVYRNENTEATGGWQAFRDDERSTVATWLDAAGYRTALVGKYLNGYGGDGHVPPGWNQWLAYIGAPGYYAYTLSDNGTLRSFGGAPRDYATDVLAERAVSLIHSTRDSTPLFLLFAPYAPHEPSTPAPRHAGTVPENDAWHSPNFNEANVRDKPRWVQALPVRSAAKVAELDRQWARQLESLRAVDEAIRSIVAALRETGRLHDTLIVFTSDNGAQLGSHRFVPKQAPYQESVKAPLVVRYDRLTRSRAGDTTDALVGNTDFAPTFAELAGVAAPRAEGRSLVPVLADPAAPGRLRFLLEHEHSTNSVPTYCGVVTRARKLIEYANGERELYELADDPYELRNRAGTPALAGVEARMHRRLRALCDPPPRGFRR